MLGSRWKSSRHPARALPGFEGVPGDDPSAAEAGGRNDPLLQHLVPREPPDGEPDSNFGNRHSTALVESSTVFHSSTSAPAVTSTNRWNSWWNSMFRLPVGPFRCFPMMNSAFPFSVRSLRLN